MSSAAVRAVLLGIAAGVGVFLGAWWLVGKL
jgi:hypothetical protein